jgi:magnesium and cobalt transporter
MSDDPQVAEPRRPLFERLASLLLRVPEDREQLLAVLRQAHERSLLDADALSMIEGVLQVAELTAANVMVPRGQMDVIDISEPPSVFLPRVIETRHSRFPVIDGDRDNVIGILHAKELLRMYADGGIGLRDLLHPASFIPESKRLNVLLRDFREDRNHLAIVVDEYGGTAGLITIEDVLEQIVGDIEDEFDLDDEALAIVAIEPGERGPRWRVNAQTTIRELNDTIGCNLSDKDVDTIGGLLACELGRMPAVGERTRLDGLDIEVLRGDARQLRLLLVERPDGREDEPDRAQTA